VFVRCNLFKANIKLANNGVSYPNVTAYGFHWNDSLLALLAIFDKPKKVCYEKRSSLFVTFLPTKKLYNIDQNYPSF